MSGRAGTSWNSGAVIPTPHMGRETYCEVVQFLHPTDGPKLTINPGDLLEFSFSLTLPNENVPCSYQNPNGYVKYSVRAVLIPVPSASQDKDEVEASFVDKDINFYASLDIISLPGINNSIEIKWSNDVSNCCLALCKKPQEPFRLSLYIPKSGFVTGETIVCDLQFSNNSKHKIPDIFINFVQKTTFVADDKSEKESQAKTISIKKGPTVPPGKTTQETVLFTVPEDSLPTRLGGCSIIHYEYFIEVEIEMDSKSLARIIRPVSIGSVNTSDVESKSN